MRKIQKSRSIKFFKDKGYAPKNTKPEEYLKKLEKDDSNKSKKQCKVGEEVQYKGKYGVIKNIISDKEVEVEFDDDESIKKLKSSTLKYMSDFGTDDGLEELPEVIREVSATKVEVENEDGSRQIVPKLNLQSELDLKSLISQLQEKFEGYSFENLIDIKGILMKRIDKTEFTNPEKVLQFLKGLNKGEVSMNENKDSSVTFRFIDSPDIKLQSTKFKSTYPRL